MLYVRRTAPVVARALRGPSSRPLHLRPRYTAGTSEAGVSAQGRRFLCSKESATKDEGAEPKVEGAEEEAAAAAEEEAAAGGEEASAVEAAEAATAKALAERDELKDQLIRAIAEAENTRTIARRDVRNAKDFAAQSFAKALLDVSDSLSYALKAAEDDDAVTVDKLKEGVELTRNQLVKAFASNGLVEYGAVDEPFDPSLHEALFEYDDADKDPATIGQLVKTGFKLHDRVIRAAQVGVVKARS